MQESEKRTFRLDDLLALFTETKEPKWEYDTRIVSSECRPPKSNYTLQGQICWKKFSNQSDKMQAAKANTGKDKGIGQKIFSQQGSKKMAHQQNAIDIPEQVQVPKPFSISALPPGFESYPIQQQQQQQQQQQHAGQQSEQIPIFAPKKADGSYLTPHMQDEIAASSSNANHEEQQKIEGNHEIAEPSFDSFMMKSDQQLTFKPSAERYQDPLNVSPKFFNPQDIIGTDSNATKQFGYQPGKAQGFGPTSGEDSTFSNQQFVFSSFQPSFSPFQQNITPVQFIDPPQQVYTPAPPPQDQPISFAFASVLGNNLSSESTESKTVEIPARQVFMPNPSREPNYQMTETKESKNEEVPKPKVKVTDFQPEKKAKPIPKNSVIVTEINESIEIKSWTKPTNETKTPSFDQVLEEEKQKQIHIQRPKGIPQVQPKNPNETKKRSGQSLDLNSIIGSEPPALEKRNDQRRGRQRKEKKFEPKPAPIGIDMFMTDQICIDDETRPKLEYHNGDQGIQTSFMGSSFQRTQPTPTQSASKSEIKQLGFVSKTISSEVKPDISYAPTRNKRANQRYGK